MNAAMFYNKSGQSPSIGVVNAFKARVLAEGGTFEGEACLLDTVKKLRSRDIYQRASIILTPNGFNTSKLYSLTPNNGTTDFTVNGGGDGSRINSSGNLVSVMSGTPKIDYTNGSCPEILMERSATNILLNSETLSTQTVTTTAFYYILSFYGTGTVTVSETTPVVLNGTGLSSRVFIAFASSGGLKNIVVSGQVKYAQLEGYSNIIYNNFPSSWIPTIETSITRSIGVLVKTDLTSIINQTKGTIIFRLVRQGRGSVFRLDDGTNNNAIRIFTPGDSNYLQIFFSKGGNIINPTISISLPNEITVAIRYTINNAEFYVNGTYYSSITNNTAATAAFGRFSFSPTESLINRLKYFAYIADSSTDDEMIKYSTPI